MRLLVWACIFVMVRGSGGSHIQSIVCGSTQPQKGKLLSLIHTIPLEYEVTFSVKPTGFTDGYTSVLHFTTGDDSGKLGTRIPGVWFYGEKLCIAGSVENNPNYYVFSQRLPKDKWANVKIVSEKHGSTYWYAVIVNGKTIVGTDNPSAQIFKSVKVYVSDPWYTPFKGSVRNLQIKVGGSEGSIIDTSVPTQPIICGDSQAKKGNLVSTITSIPPEYEVTFSVKPTGFANGVYESVLHFTTGDDSGKLGTRIPGVWFYWDKLCIAGSVENNSNYYVFSQRLPKDKWANVKIVGEKHGSTYWYAVIVNGKTIVGTDNPSAQTFKNVKVYVGDPWYTPFEGFVRNLRIEVAA